MKLLLVMPTTVYKDGRLLKSKRRWVLGLHLPLVAALTPDWVDVKLVDDRMDEIPYDGGWDMAAMTTTIASATRAYQIADEFRKRGVPVVMGGFHATLQPDECLQHCDAVVMGEAEYVWPQLLEDFKARKMKQRYKAERLHDMKGLPRPRWDLVDRSKYVAPFMPLQTTRGCPFKCAFCEVPQFYGGTYRHRPIGEVVEDFQHVPGRRVQVVDDNITGNKEYARELFKALIPLRSSWSCLWTINTSRDPELLDLAKKAGVFHVNIGIESISQKSLQTVNKRQNLVKDYVDMLKALESRGIFYSLNFLFGLDEDTPEIFAETMDFLREINPPMAFFNTVTPRKGTPMRAQLEKEGRILNPMADRYLGMECLFQPKNMTARQVEDGVWDCFQEFYSPAAILKRFLKPPYSYVGQGLPSNLVFWWFVRRKIDPVDNY